jgi:hypothetical protein
MALHEQSVGATDEWYTPPYVFEAMGVDFHMDVASPGAHITPWIPAIRFVTSRSLSREWKGSVWMNPPFGARNGLRPWLDKFFSHRNGVALVPDRTSAPWWQDYADRSDLILFVRKKIRFIRPDGTTGNSPAQGTTLLAVGPRGVVALENACRAGIGLTFKPTRATMDSGPMPGMTNNPSLLEKLAGGERR